MYYEKHCSRCKKNVHCCINGFVFLTMKDAGKIKKKTKMDYPDFLDDSKLPKNIIEQMKDEDPCLEGALRYSQLDKGRILRLKKKNGMCIFFDGKKCRIYDIRPNICRIYPFWAIRLNSGKVKIIEHDPDIQCSVVKGKDVDEMLSGKQKEEIKRVFRWIERERV